jgi:hypothetical protein
MFLCTCNNCGNVYKDRNPGIGPIEYDERIYRMFGLSELPVIRLEDGDRGYGCPECKTDGYVVTNVNGYAGGKAAEIQRYLDKSRPVILPHLLNTRVWKQ